MGDTLLDGLIITGYGTDIVHVLIAIGVLLEARLLVGSVLNVQFVIENGLNGLKRLSALSTMRRKVFKIVAMLLLVKEPSIFAQLAVLVLVADGVFAWRDLVYYTHLLKHES